jgi:dUTP pyrophosphatase
MDILQQLLAAFDDLFTMEDSELEAAMPVISQELTNAFMGPAVEAQIDEYFRQCDLMGYTLDQYSKDLEAGRAALYQVMTEIKEKYPGSQIKAELVDMVYSLIESFYAVIALRITNRDKVTIGIEIVHPDAKIPTYAHEGDQGADIYAVEDTIIEPHTFGNMIPTGLKMMIPHGWAVAIRPRSGMSRTTPLRISNSPATIDQQYRGEVKILFDNFSDKPVEIKAGDRIAQFIIEKNYRGDYIQVDTVEPDTDRGEGGFGSSGN